MVQHQQLTRVLHELASLVNDDFSVDDAARVLVSAVSRVLEVDGAGISVADEDGAMRFVHGTSESVATIERVQEELQEGPCQESRHRRQPVYSGDVAGDARWPEAYRDAVREAGFRSAATFPLQARDRVWGALDLYRAAAVPLSEEELAAGQALAHVATGFLVLAADRQALRVAQLELSRRAMYDTLTGLPVRWVLVDHLDRALSVLRRTGAHVGVLFVDLDGLKYVNDTAGHTAGDKLIRSSAEALQRAVRPTDVVARVGGDEFVVVLADVAEPGAAEEVAERVLDALAHAARSSGRHGLGRSASVGVTTTDDPDASADTLISYADAAMYQAKRAGGGRMAVFDPSVYAAATSREELMAELAGALTADQFELHYQPIVELRDRSVHAVEALLRWRHPKRGLLVAGEFIGLLEGSLLIREVGAWMLRTACAQLASWDAEIPEAAPRRMFVNISPGELAHPTIEDRVRAALDLGGLDGPRLVLEITETEALTHARAAATVTDLRARLGCGVAIDDFGTGHSSLSRLVQLPADAIKIDQSFTSRLLTSPDVEPVVSAMVHVADKLGRDIVIEGVEDDSSHAAAAQLGCRYGQGYHFARPQAADQLTPMLLAGLDN